MSKEDKLKEIHLMRKYAYLIWGGVPHDVDWAINTLVWKEFKNKFDL